MEITKLKSDKILYNIAYLEWAIMNLEWKAWDDIYQALDYIKEELNIKF